MSLKALTKDEPSNSYHPGHHLALSLYCLQLSMPTKLRCPNVQPQSLTCYLWKPYRCTHGIKTFYSPFHCTCRLSRLIPGTLWLRGRICSWNYETTNMTSMYLSENLLVQRALTDMVRPLMASSKPTWECIWRMPVRHQSSQTPSCPKIHTKWHWCLYANKQRFIWHCIHCPIVRRLPHNTDEWIYDKYLYA